MKQQQQQQQQQQQISRSWLPFSSSSVGVCNVAHQAQYLTGGTHGTWPIGIGDALTMPMTTQATNLDTLLEHLCLDCGQGHPAAHSIDRVECYVCGLQLCCLQGSSSTDRCQHCEKRHIAAREPIDVSMNVINAIHPDAYRAIKNTRCHRLRPISD